MWLVGPGNSLDVSATFPSVTFPSTFPLRFRLRLRQCFGHDSVSANVFVTFPLHRSVPDGNYPETPPTFPGPTKVMYLSFHQLYSKQHPSELRDKCWNAAIPHRYSGSSSDKPLSIGLNTKQIAGELVVIRVLLDVCVCVSYV